MDNYIVKTKDEIVINVIKELDERSLAGIQKYQSTLKDSRDDFLQHLKEELLDSINYIEKLQYEIKKLGELRK